MNDKNQHLLYSCASPKQVENDLQTLMDFQTEGITLEELNQIIKDSLIPHLVLYDRPEFHSLYNFFPEPGAEMGARIALKYNQGVTNWQVSPGAVMVEEMCCQALCRMFGFSQSSDATFMYSGTYANQQAVYLALHRKAQQQGFDFSEQGLSGFKQPEKLVLIASKEAHFSLKHTLRMLGLGDRSLITVPVDHDCRMDVNRLGEIVLDLKNSRDIFCITATAGTTSTGSVDPIIPIIKFCDKIGAWSHIDGAYGLAFSLLPEKKHLFAEMELADSVCWDPHKQFGVPIPSSLLFVRNKEDFNRMAVYGHYFNRKGDPEPNPGLKSPPSTRPFSALPLVTTIRHQGLKKIIQTLRKPVKTIQKLAEKLKIEPDFELCNQPETGILCIRINPEDFPEQDLNQLQEFVYEKIKNEGKRSISITKLESKTVLRIVAISSYVTTTALMDTISVIRKFALEFRKI